jgi:hypothetical protein
MNDPQQLLTVCLNVRADGPARHAYPFDFEPLNAGSHACLFLVLAIYLGVRPAAADSR